jgi:integrase
MFLRFDRRFKDGKEHRYWNIVENRRCVTGKVAQRQALYLGEINDSQREAWCRVIEAFDEDAGRTGSWRCFPPIARFRSTRRAVACRCGMQLHPPMLSPEEVKRVLTLATSLKARAMLSLAYGCGLRASEVARLRACDIDSEQMIIRIVQSKGRKDRNVMLPADREPARAPDHAAPQCGLSGDASRRIWSSRRKD